MTTSREVVRAIEALNAICRPHGATLASTATSDIRPAGSLDAARCFGQHGKLFPFLGRKVRTPNGPGTLLQVFTERVTVCSIRI
jgi:hypothetical protein